MHNEKLSNKGVEIHGTTVLNKIYFVFLLSFRFLHEYMYISLAPPIQDCQFLSSEFILNLRVKKLENLE